MFESLASYRCVIVTGPQRSGTTLCTRAVAQDTGLLVVDEDDYGTKDVDAWKETVAHGRGVVVHSPAMSRFVTDVAGRDDVFVIWMLRPMAQILVSESRIDWSDKDERGKYRDVPGYKQQHPICGVKLTFWREHQRDKVRHWREVRYEELKAHPLWVKPEKRSNFAPRQWTSQSILEQT